MVAPPVGVTVYVTGSPARNNAGTGTTNTWMLRGSARARAPRRPATPVTTGASSCCAAARGAAGARSSVQIKAERPAGDIMVS